jgi:hypothetical protein
MVYVKSVAVKVKVQQSEVHVSEPLSAGSSQFVVVIDVIFQVPTIEGAGSSFLLQAIAVTSSAMTAIRE